MQTFDFQAPTGYPPHAWTSEEKAGLKEALETVATKESRHISHMANAHEFADRPPPTPEDEARLSATLDKIFSKESNMENATQTVDMSEVAVKSAEAAEQLLAQDGWSIVRELHTAVLDSINATGLVVLPIMANLDDYKLTLKDPAGFEQRFETLTGDIAKVMVTTKTLADASLGKSGKPTPAELDDISRLTLDYTIVQGYIERTIQPLILVLVDELEAAGITELKVEAKEGIQDV